MKALLLLTLLFTASAFAVSEWPVTLITPTERTDNTDLPLSEIAGVNMYCGDTVGDWSRHTYFPGATLPDTTVIATDLAPGTHYCVFTVEDIDGRTSEYSLNHVTLINDGQATPKRMIVPDGLVVRVTTTIQP